MNSEEISALINLASALAPPVLTFVNNAIQAFNDSGLTAEQRMNEIVSLQAKLLPMKPIPEAGA